MKSVLDYVVEGTAWTRQLKPGHPDLYFFFYLLETLAKHGRTDVAELRIREVYGDLQRRGFWTLPESYQRAVNGRDSHCHAWSSGPSRYMMEQTLGLQQVRSGDTRNWIVVPAAATVTWARGAMPTPHGLIQVEWELVGGKRTVTVQAPKGVSVRVPPSRW